MVKKSVSFNVQTVFLRQKKSTVFTKPLKNLMDYQTHPPKCNQRNQRGSLLTFHMLMYILVYLYQAQIHTVSFLKPWFICTCLSRCWTKYSSRPIHYEPYLALNFVLPQFSEFYLLNCCVLTQLFANEAHGKWKTLLYYLYVAKGWEWSGSNWEKRRGNQQLNTSEHHLNLWIKYERLYMLSK